jgi:hypothetical protein
MASKTAIANKTMINIGEAIFVDVDSDGTTPANEFNALWTATLEDALTTGPEQGYAFSQWSTSEIDVNNTAITAFADYSGTVTGTVKATSTAHDLLTGDAANIKDGSIGAYDSCQIITRIDADNFYFTATFSATETATAQWTSEKLAYRYARPSVLQVTRVCVGGLDISDWKRRGNYILTNREDTSVAMDYIKAVADLTVTEFPQWFNEIVWRKMAIGMVYSRVQSLGFRDRLIQEIEQIYIPRAKGMDAREQFVQESSNSWVSTGHSTGIEGDFPLGLFPSIFKR